MQEAEPGKASIAQAHCCNASLHVVGNPEFGIHAWIRHVVAACGGFVGHVHASGNAGFVAFVPAEGDPAGRIATLPPPDFTASGGAAADMAVLLAELAVGRPMLEASCSFAGSSCDLVRGSFRTEGHGAVQGSAGRKSHENAQSPLAAAMERRIRTGATAGGFLFSISDCGEALVIVGGNATAAEIRISGDRAALKSGDAPVQLHQAAPALAALAGRRDVPMLSISAGGAVAGMATTVLGD